MNRRSLFSRMAAAAAGVVLASSVEVMGFIKEVPAILKTTLSKSVNSAALCVSNIPIPAQEQTLRSIENHCMEMLMEDLPEGYTLREAKGVWKDVPDRGALRNVKYFSAWAIADQI